MTSTQLEDFATRYTAAWNAHDAHAATSCYAETGSLSINGGEPATGRAAVEAVMPSFCDAFPDAVLTMDKVRGASDKAIYLWTYEGTNTGPGGPATRSGSADGRLGRSRTTGWLPSLSGISTRPRTNASSNKGSDHRISPSVGM
jgi:uncharacterized protein (TIGR02246 family)